MTPARIPLGPRDGQAVILVVVSMGLLLIGTLGFAIDGAQLFAQRQMAQAAADAAAQAGIMSIMNGTNATGSYTFGTGSTPIANYTCTTSDGRTPCVYARNNGFGGTASDTVTLSYPATVTGATLSSVTVPALQVKVQRNLQTGLTRFLGGPATTSVTAKATAGITGSVWPESVFVLGSGPGTFQATNGATVTVSGGVIAINSSNAGAAVISGSSVVTAAAVDIVGGASISGGGVSHPTPVTGTASVGDPLASLPAPTVGACAHTNYAPGYGTWTLDPGVYCGGISISNGATATFNPGTYIINGGSLSLTGGTTNTGAGITFFLTGTNSTYGSVNISNGASATFSGPTSGTYTGILFYQDRSLNPAANATFTGGSTMLITGTLYFPTTTVSFSNGAGAQAESAIVANKVIFTGGTSIKYDPTGVKTGLNTDKGAALMQ